MWSGIIVLPKEANPSSPSSLGTWWGHRVLDLVLLFLPTPRQRGDDVSVFSPRRHAWESNELRIRKGKAPFVAALERIVES
ncbi:hypothetical protein NL676_011711 [Syzygium grande]|nr:hypothetical protein NL676_011711 [Syzygium grande]